MKGFKIILLLFISFFSIKNNTIVAQSIDSTALKTAVSTTDCVQNQKKFTGKEIILKGLIVGSTQLEVEKEGAFIILEMDDHYPNNKVTILLNVEQAESMDFSRYSYHNKKVAIRGKLEKNKKFKDEFGNPRLVINVKTLNQILFL